MSINEESVSGFVSDVSRAQWKQSWIKYKKVYNDCMKNLEKNCDETLLEFLRPALTFSQQLCDQNEYLVNELEKRSKDLRNSERLISQRNSLSNVLSNAAEEEVNKNSDDVATLLKIISQLPAAPENFDLSEFVFNNIKKEDVELALRSNPKLDRQSPIADSDTTDISELYLPSLNQDAEHYTSTDDAKADSTLESHFNSETEISESGNFPNLRSDIQPVEQINGASNGNLTRRISEPQYTVMVEQNSNNTKLILTFKQPLILNSLPRQSNISISSICECKSSTARTDNSFQMEYGGIRPTASEPLLIRQGQLRLCKFCNGMIPTTISK